MIHEPANRQAARSRASGGLLPAQAELLYHLLAHQELLDLAGHRRRKAVDELDVARDLVMGDLSLAEGADLLGARRLAVAQANPGAELLAVARVGDADDLHILDLRVAVEELFDLARIDVLAAADHHVLDPADDVAIALRVDRCEVAGVHPAGRVNRLAGPLLIPPIAEHDQIAARQQFAGGAARHDAALGIDDLDLDMRQY